VTKDEIISMAREAGVLIPQHRNHIEELQRFAELVAAAEREACAKVCESNWTNVVERIYGKECAAAIRARGAR